MTISANCPGQLQALSSVDNCPGQLGTPDQSARRRAGEGLSQLSGTVRGQVENGPPAGLSAAPAPLGADSSGTVRRQDVRCRLAGGVEVPRSARRLMDAALAAGWTVAPTYARRAGLETLALRMWRRRGRAVAVWTNDGFSFAYTWSDVLPIRKWRYRELVQAVTHDAL